MELSIPSHSIKDFTAVLKCFKSFSDQLSIQPTPSILKLSVVSSTRSAYAVANYDGSYFDSYKLYPNQVGLIDVAIKPLYKILSQKSFPSSIESCHISIQSDAPAHDARSQNHPAQGGTAPLEPSSHNRVKIQLHLAVGIVKTFSLQYSLSRALNPIEVRSMNSPNYWICQSVNLKQWIDHFITNPNLTGGGGRAGADASEEISFCYHQDGRIILKTVNLSDDWDQQGVVVPKNVDVFAKGARQVSTALTLSSYEFEDYNVVFDDSSASQASNQPTQNGTDPKVVMITISMKEFRSILELGTVLDAPVDVGFSVGGRPFYVSIANADENVKMDFILASTSGEELGALRRAGPVESAHAVRPSTTRHDRPDPNGIGRNHRLSQTLTPQRAPDPADPVAGPSRPRVLVPDTASPLFRVEEDVTHDGPDQLDRDEEEAEFADDLDRLDPNEWDELEQMAIAQSQARESQRRLSQQENHQESIAKQQHDQSNNALEDDDDDERLLPSQTHRHEQPKGRWRLFDDD